jgi:hypothetical protein
MNGPLATVRDVVERLHTRTDPMKPFAAIAETFGRADQMTDVGPLVSQRLQMYLITLPKKRTISSIAFLSSGTAFTPANDGNDHQIFGLFDYGRNLLASTVDDTNTAWATNFLKPLNLTASYRTTYSGHYYLGILVRGTTMPRLFGSQAAAGTNAQEPIIGGTSTTGLNAMPALADAITGLNFRAYAQVR